MEALCTRESAAEVWRSRHFGPCGGATLGSVSRPMVIITSAFSKAGESCSLDSIGK
jgi:hypothetical protein